MEDKTTIELTLYELIHFQEALRRYQWRPAKDDSWQEFRDMREILNKKLKVSYEMLLQSERRVD